MAHALNLGVVSEGVENVAQRAFLERSGCDLLQGYYFAKPGPPFVPVDGVKAWLSEKK